MLRYCFEFFFPIQLVTLERTEPTAHIAVVPLVVVQRKPAITSMDLASQAVRMDTKEKCVVITVRREREKGSCISSCDDVYDGGICDASKKRKRKGILYLQLW